MRIEADQLSKCYRRLEALCDITFKVDSGCRVALVGANGSGKSTLNRVLAGLLSFRGSLRLGGFEQPTEWAQVSRGRVYVPQTAPQSNVPVREVVQAFARVRGLTVEQLCCMARNFDLELSAIEAAPLRTLSGGMRQKLLLSLALAVPAKLYILDEPTASLDVYARERFFELFSELSRDATLVLCSHRLEEVRPLVDSVLHLSEGRLVYQGGVRGFLDARARSVIEVNVAPGSESVLRARGFRAGAGDWWMRSVTRGEKPSLLEELLRELGARVRDLNVRELEGLDCENEPPDDNRSSENEFPEWRERPHESEWQREPAPGPEGEPRGDA